jgi:hypothetical protein
MFFTSFQTFTPLLFSGYRKGGKISMSGTLHLTWPFAHICCSTRTIRSRDIRAQPEEPPAYSEGRATEGGNEARRRREGSTARPRQAQIVNRKSQGFGSVSRVLFPSGDGRRSFLWTSRCRLALPPSWEATYPPAERPKPLAPGPGAAFADRLLGLAGGGVFPAGDVTAAAVRSYRTISPLPEPHPQRCCASGEAIGRVFSVALSLGSPDFTAIARS